MFSPDYQRHRRSVTRPNLDKEIFSHPEIQGFKGSVIDLAGPGIIRRYLMTKPLWSPHGRYIAVERDTSTFNQMVLDAECFDTFEPKPPQIVNGDIFETIRDYPKGYFHYILRCGTKRLRTQLEEEGAWTDLWNLIQQGYLIAPFALMTTASRRGETKKQQASDNLLAEGIANLGAQLAQIQGTNLIGKWVKTWPYGNPRNGQSLMRSDLFTFTTK